MKNKRTLPYILLLLLLLLLIGGGYWLFIRDDSNEDETNQNGDQNQSSEANTNDNANDNSNNTESNDQKKCRSTANADLDSMPEFNYTHYYVQVNQESLYDSEKVDARPLSISELNTDEPTYDLIFDLKRQDYEKFPHYKVALELCDENNVATRSLDEINFTPRDNEVAGVLHYLHGDQGVLPEEPGTYRLDIYLNKDNEWLLLEQVENVEFEE